MYASACLTSGRSASAAVNFEPPGCPAIRTAVRPRTKRSEGAVRIGTALGYFGSLLPSPQRHRDLRACRELPIGQPLGNRFADLRGRQALHLNRPDERRTDGAVFLHQE